MSHWKMTVAACLCVASAEASPPCRQQFVKHVAVQQVVAHHEVQAVIAAPVAAIPIIPQTYYQVGYGVREEAAEERIAQRVVQMMGQYVQQQQQVRQPQMQPLAQQFSQPQAGCTNCACKVPGAQQPSAPTTQPELPAAPAQGNEKDAKVQELFRQNCVQCHDGSNSARIDLRDAVAVRAKACMIFKSVYTGKMPKGRNPLSDAEVGVLLDWMADTAD